MSEERAVYGEVAGVEACVETIYSGGEGAWREMLRKMLGRIKDQEAENLALRDEALGWRCQAEQRWRKVPGKQRGVRCGEVPVFEVGREQMVILTDGKSVWAGWFDAWRNMATHWQYLPRAFVEQRVGARPCAPTEVG